METGDKLPKEISRRVMHGKVSNQAYTVIYTYAYRVQGVEVPFKDLREVREWLRNK